jgi:hypothetical protein
VPSNYSAQNYKRHLLHRRELISDRFAHLLNRLK